jgi:hypothetical protein
VLDDKDRRIDLLVDGPDENPQGRQAAGRRSDDNNPQIVFAAGRSHINRESNPL